jgi:hypothetical protein
VEREAVPYDEAAVLAAKSKKKTPCACPGSMAKAIVRSAPPQATDGIHQESQLRQWPVQIKLVPVTAPWFQGADLLVAADCAAYAYADFHRDFIAGRITLVGCPKLDDVDYTNKLTEILLLNEIRSVTVVRMSVPCCAGIASAVERAVKNSGKSIPLRTVIITTDGQIQNH